MGSSLSSSEEGFERASRRSWEHRRGESVTDEDLREINQNLLEYFRLLHAWDKKAKLPDPQPHRRSPTIQKPDPESVARLERTIQRKGPSS